MDSLVFPFYLNFLGISDAEAKKLAGKVLRLIQIRLTGANSAKNSTHLSIRFDLMTSFNPVLPTVKTEIWLLLALTTHRT